MSTAMATIEDSGVAIDHGAILKSLNLDVRQPATQALLLICDRYALDPLLKHIVLIQGSIYVTRDGYLAIAHKSGVFDGMEVLEQGSDQTHFTAKVAVYRKDMGRPFTFIGRYPKASRMAKEYGPEMAVKVAEVQALRRAFNVTGVGAADERWDSDAAPVVADVPALPPANVDAETGEVVEAPVTRKRKPPGAAMRPTQTAAPVVDVPAPLLNDSKHTGVGGVGVAASERPAKPAMANPDQVVDVTMAIDNLKACGDEWMQRGREAWKAAGIPAKGAHELTEDQATLAFEVLDKVLLEAKAVVTPTLDA